MDKSEQSQTKFQKFCLKVAKLSFWLWIATMAMFAFFVIYVQMPENFKKIPTWFGLGDILLGVVAFVVAIISYYISRPRPVKDTKSILQTLGVGVAGLSLLIILGMLPNNLGNVHGVKVYSSPFPPITINTTPQPTPIPKAKTTTTLPKSPQITCTGPDYKTFQTTESECIKFRTSWGLSASATPWPDAITVRPKQANSNVNTNTNTIPTSTYKPTLYPVCIVHYSTINLTSTYYYMTAEECAEAQRKATTSVATPAPNPVDTAALISECKASVDAKYYPIFQRCNSYDAATHQLCYETNTNSKNAEYSTCNSLGN